MKKFSKLQIFAWVLALVPVIMVAVSYPHLPEQVPTHWNLDGTVTYGPKSTLWMLGGMTIPLAILLPVVARIDPRRKNYEKFLPSYDLFQVVLMLFMIAMSGMTISETFYPGRINVGTVVCGLISLLFIILGNMLPKFRQNYSSGIKTPWALASEAVWTKTQRLGGQVMFGVGVVGLLTCFLPDMPRFVILMTGVALIALLPVVMSYVWYRREGSDK